MTEAIIDAREGNWFDNFCAEKGLVRQAPKPAREIVVGDVLFSANGLPRKVTRVRVFKHYVRIWHDDYDFAWSNDDENVSLIAKEA